MLIYPPYIYQMALLKSKLNILTIILLVVTINCSAQTDTTQHRVQGRSNTPEQQQKPYVIMISMDGFRYDYADKYQATNLLRLSGQGVRAAAMMPSFPSLTFPNHYTLATGLYPSHHGLVANSFYDPQKKDKYTMSDKTKVTDSSWYGGTPLWVLAEQQQMLAASLFWVGSEAAVKGTRASYYYNYNEDIPIPRRIQIVKDWLSLPAVQRPHLIMFYLSEPDHAGHTYGPDAPQTGQAVKMVDEVINQLTEMAKTTGLPVNFVVVSDHGMTEVDRDHPLALPVAIDPEKFIIPSSGTMVDIHAKNPADIQPLYDLLKKDEKDYKVYLKTNMPDYLHYGSKDDTMNRIGDILIIPEWPKVFSNRPPGMGYHGFDPYKVKNMQASFFAWGPAFKSGLKIPMFENVNVYPLVAEILGLTITDKIDGKREVLQNVLK
jgi:predicted AlkP superfamily pyrophosphatase or phosphodiesterase